MDEGEASRAIVASFEACELVQLELPQ